MTHLTQRILALFPPDGSTEFTAKGIGDALGITADRARRLCADLQIAGKLSVRNEPPKIGKNWYRLALPDTESILRDLAARRTALIDEAVRRCFPNIRRILEMFETFQNGQRYYSSDKTAWERFVPWLEQKADFGENVPYGCHADCIRSEFSKLCEERA